MKVRAHDMYVIHSGWYEHDQKKSDIIWNEQKYKIIKLKHLFPTFYKN